MCKRFKISALLIIPAVIILIFTNQLFVKLMDRRIHYFDALRDVLIVMKMEGNAVDSNADFQFHDIVLKHTGLSGSNWLDSIYGSFPMTPEIVYKKNIGIYESKPYPINILQSDYLIIDEKDLSLKWGKSGASVLYKSAL